MLGHAAGPAPARPSSVQLAQPARPASSPSGTSLARILVAQLVEREVAALGDAQRLGEQLRRIELREPQPRPQVPLAVGKQREAALGAPWRRGGWRSARPAGAGARARACARRRPRRAAGPRRAAKRAQLREPGAVVGPASSSTAIQARPGKRSASHCGFSRQGRGKGGGRRDEQRQAVVRARASQIVLRQPVAALRRARAARG